MSESVKSSLVLGQSKKSIGKKSESSAPDIEYKQVANNNDFIGQLSDEQKEAEFNKQHEDYMKMKIERKQQQLRIKREEFGSSSSSDSQDDSSDEEIQVIKKVKKVESKSSRGRIGKKNSANHQQAYLSVLLELKKTTVESQLQLKEKDFQINKRTIPYTRINKLNLSTFSQGSHMAYKLRIGILGDEDLVIFLNEKEEKYQSKIVEIFLSLMRITFDFKAIKLNQESSRCNLEQFNQVRQGAIVYDKIYKKSQIIGTWDERYIVIKPQGLFSYRNLKEKSTMDIPLKQITQVQTQFQLYKDLLVMKLFYNGTKTDFGLPLDPKMEWISSFTKLVAIE